MTQQPLPAYRQRLAEISDEALEEELARRKVEQQQQESDLPRVLRRIGFSVLDGTVERAGGVGKLDTEFRARIVRAHAQAHVPSGLVMLRHLGRAHEREQWQIETVRPDLHAALAELVIAWEETEDVDTLEEI